jgi:RNA polymerase sigma-70 factor (ECF subfamily)
MAGLEAIFNERADEVLAGRVAARDLDALSLLYDRYSQPVYAMAAHILGSNEAEDVVQETFLRLWQHAAQFDHRRGSFAPWFLAIARHEVIARLRRRGKDRQLAAIDDVDQLFASMPEPGPSVEELVWMNERSEIVMRALQALPGEQRRVLMLAYFGGHSQAAIAEMLEIPLGTVKKRIRLGLQKLRKSLGAGESAESEILFDGLNGFQPTHPLVAGVSYDDEL